MERRRLQLANSHSGGGTNLVKFTIDNMEAVAEQGMTWQEWISSDYYDYFLAENYAIFNITIIGNELIWFNLRGVSFGIYWNNIRQTPTDSINNKNYQTIRLD